MTGPPAAGLRLALTTLTVLPVRGGPVDRRTAGAAMAWAPAVGLALGGAATGLGWCLRHLGLDPLPAAAVLVIALALVTRGLHLDGLADTVDALASYRDSDGALAVMKSPEVGPLGTAAIGGVLLVDAAALTTLLDRHAWLGIALGVAAGRLAITLCCTRGIPPARPDGLGALVAGTVAPWVCALWAVALVGAAAALHPHQWWRAAVAVLLAGALITLLLRHIRRRIGGVTGDVLGAACESATAVALLVLATH